MTTMKTTQATMTFNHDLDGIGSCEVRATWFLGSVRLNSVRRNSDYNFVNLTDGQERDVKNMARWYFQDEIA
ncbi:unnamed protein product [uncultured bacterium]|nr:unnamed protein product [uncultured bacterium]